MYRILMSCLLFLVVSQAHACFINGNSCWNEQQMFSLQLDGVSTSAINIACDDYGPYWVSVNPDDSRIVSVSQSGTQLNSVDQIQTNFKISGLTSFTLPVVLSTIDKNGTTDVKIAYGPESDPNTTWGTCNGSVTVRGLAENDNTTSSNHSTAGETSTSTGNSSISPSAAVNNVNGQFYVATVKDINTPSANTDTSGISALLTEQNSSSSVTRSDGTNIELAEKTLLLLNPTQNSVWIMTLIRGEVTTDRGCNESDDYEVRTHLAKIMVKGDCSTSLSTRKKASTTINFTTSFEQNGTQGILTIKVLSGALEVADRNGNIQVLSAGQETTIQNNIPRATWVLPIDGDAIYGGKDNLLSWTAFPGASGYLLEYNLPSPIFSEENTSQVEFSTQVLRLNNGDYSQFEDLITYSIPLQTGMEGTIVEARIFALDANGEIIAQSVSSDRTTVTWK